MAAPQCGPRFEERASAKINLTLKVRGQRADGYHDIESLVAFASVGDRVALDMSRPQRLTVTGAFSATITGENLIERTLRRLAEAEPLLRLGEVQLEKSLPVASGIGGGSADAAAVVRAVRAANPDFVERVDWHQICQSLGADVPVCFAQRPALMCGIGETLTPVEAMPAIDVVLVNPMATVPSDKTAQVFRRLRAPKLASDDCQSVDRTPMRFASRDALLDYMLSAGNELTGAAAFIVPEIDTVLDALADIDAADYAAMSGAGPTCFAVMTDRAAAETAVLTLQKLRPDWWCVAAVIAGQP